jgi:hypothetical protein
MARKGLGSLLDDVAEDIAQPVPATPEPAIAASSGNLPVPSADWRKTLQEIERINSGLNSLVGSMEASRMLFRQAAEKIDGVNLNLEDAAVMLRKYEKVLTGLDTHLHATVEKATAFVYRCTIDSVSMKEFTTACSSHLNAVKHELELFEDRQEKWITARKSEIRDILEKEDKGVWLSNSNAQFVCFLFVLLFVFFVLTIVFNIISIHSGCLTKMLWIFGSIMVLAVGLFWWFNRKT